MANTTEAYKKIILDRLYVAYMEARKAKRQTMDENAFEMNAVENLVNLRDAIISREYKPSRGIAFITRRPVIREIFAAPFRDRVVHHLLFDMVEPWWDRRFIYDSYSCRKGKGTLFGMERLAYYMRKVSRNYTRETYVIKLDVQGYFMSLPRAELYKRVTWGLRRQFPNGGDDYELCDYLWREIIFDDPIRGVRRRGRLDDWRDLPKSKSLFCQPPGQGIVIGNLSSQLLSNIYLDQLDRFVTYDLGYKAYGRYVDDFFIVVEEDRLAQAKRDIKVIEEYLMGLKLTLHPNKRYVQNIKRGVPFLGVIVYPGRMIPARRIIKNFTEATVKYTEGRTDEASVLSYLGHLKHFDSTAIEKKIFERAGWDYRP